MHQAYCTNEIQIIVIKKSNDNADKQVNLGLECTAYISEGDR